VLIDLPLFSWLICRRIEPAVRPTARRSRARSLRRGAAA